MTSSSLLRRNATVVLAITAFFATAAYTSFGCGGGPYAQPEAWPKPPKNSSTVTVVVKDWATGDTIEGASVTLIQGRAGKTIAAGIGGSAYFYEGFREGAVKIEVRARGYQSITTDSALLAGYNEREVRIRRLE